MTEQHVGSGATTRAVTNQGQLETELAFLFGRDVLARSKQMNLEDMTHEAELVARAARQLRESEGRPEDARRIIQSMGEDAATALCKWIREPGCVAPLIGRRVN